ncbi:MAG: IS110 family transposase [Bryobacteraceae bacterium]
MPNTSKSKQKVLAVELTIGLDLGDRWAQLCALDQEGEIVDEGGLKLTQEALRTRFSGVPRARIALETKTHSLWVSALLTELGHEVIVANVRELAAISGSNRKSDQNVKLARYARVDPSILCPIQHRSTESQLELSVIRARAALVRARTLLINTARGIAKPLGYGLPKCTSKAFATTCREQLPEALKPVLLPVISQVEQLTDQINHYRKQVEAAAEAKGHEMSPLLSVPGVGNLTAVTFVLTVGDKERFNKSRDVACYLGLQPKRSQSGERDPGLGITKAGNGYLRTLLVECAQHVLGPFGPDSALRQWGLKLAYRGGKGSKRKAIVAVARKLAALLHRLWVTQRNYEPFYGVAEAA